MSSPPSFDYVVVGAGSAGCAVANRLSEDEDIRVLLLEAGSWDTRPEIHAVDANSVLSLLTAPWSAHLDWGYATEEEKGLGGRRVPIARGRVVGGCSSVNALMWVRGNRRDYDGWAARGNAGWAFDDVLPYFIRAEDYDGPADPLRGEGGPVAVHRLVRRSPVAEAFVAAAAELSYADGTDIDYNGARQEGFGFYYQTTQTRDGRRSSTATAYLRPARGRSNLTVIVGAQVTRLRIDGGRVTGVDYVARGRTATADAEREVVLSAGAFETPKLLMLSGIGPADGLRRHGIACRHELPGVGRNLQDHLFVPVCYRSREDHPAGALISEAGLFTRTPLAEPTGSPDLQFTFGPVTFLPAGFPTAGLVGPCHTFAPIGLLPRSRGELTLRSADPAERAMVRAGYLTEDADVDVLVHGVRLARELARTRAFDGLRGDELGPGPDVGDDERHLRAYVRANATTLWHPVGTCRMGTDSMAVVDPNLRVHGIDGLRVADASVMPDIVAGNTNAASVMIGERAADLLTETASTTRPKAVAR